MIFVHIHSFIHIFILESFFNFCRLSIAAEEALAVTKTLESTRKQLDTILKDQTKLKLNFHETCESYEKKIKYFVEKILKLDQNLIILKDKNEELNAAVENLKTNSKNLQNILVEKDIEIRRNETRQRGLKSQINNFEILKFENSKLKEFSESSKIKNSVVEEEIRNVKIELKKHEEDKIILKSNCDENMKLLKESKRNEEKKDQQISFLEKRREEENQLNDEKLQFLITKLEQEHKFEKENLDRSLQQENLTLKNDLNQVIFSLEKNHETEILKTSRIRNDEIEKIKTQHESQLHSSEILKNKEINELRTDSENRLLNFKIQYDSQVSVLNEKLDKMQEKEIIDKMISIELMQEKINQLRSDMNEKFNIDKNNTDIELKDIKNKLIIAEEKLVMCQLEKDKELEITTKYCDEKLFSEYEELLEALEMLENKFKTAQNEIQYSVFLNNEFSKNFISCCDAMNQFDNDLSVLVEGGRTGASQSSQFNDSIAHQIIEDVLVTRKLEMNERWTVRDSNKTNQRNYGPALQALSPSLIPSFYTPRRINNSEYQSTPLNYQEIPNNEGTFVHTNSM